MDNLSKLIVLRYGLNNPVSNSVVFNRILTRIGYFKSPVDLIIKMEQEGLVSHQGYIDATSGVLKYIKTTENGKLEYFNNLKSVQIPNNIGRQTINLLKNILI